FFSMSYVLTDSHFLYTTLFRSADSWSETDVIDAGPRPLDSSRRHGGLRSGRRGTAGTHPGARRAAPSVSRRAGLPRRRLLAQLRSEEHTSELQSREDIVWRLLL